MYTGAERGFSMSQNLNTIAKPIICIYSIVVLLISVGCSPLIENDPPQLNGTFNGDNGDGSNVRLTLAQKHNTITGQGVVGDQAFQLSALVSWQGPALLTFDNGVQRTGRIALSVEGTSATLSGLEDPLTLSMGGERVSPPSGRFSGRFESRGVIPIWLILTQGGDLVSGIGYIDGKPIAVAGKTDSADSARGNILFSDESRNAVTITLSADGNTLTVLGLGGSFEMMRR